MGTSSGKLSSGAGVGSGGDGGGGRASMSPDDHLYPVSAPTGATQRHSTPTNGSPKLLALGAAGLQLPSTVPHPTAITPAAAAAAAAAVTTVPATMATNGGGSRRLPGATSLGGRSGRRNRSSSDRYKRSDGDVESGTFEHQGSMSKRGSKRARSRSRGHNTADAAPAVATAAGGAGAGAGAGAGVGASKAAPRQPPQPPKSKTKVVGTGPPYRVLPVSDSRKLEDHFDMPATRKRLGRGHYGTVHFGTNIITNESVAIKRLPKTKARNVEMIRKEIRILRMLRHPNIVRLIDAFEDEDCVYLVLELCTGGELFDQITAKQQHTEQEAAAILRTLLGAIQCCHKHGVVHRDLKPENFLLSHKGADAELKIIDFGLSDQWTGEPLTSRVGTPYYIAPEVLEKSYGPQCDMWSIGVVLYILLCGYPPFWGDRDQDIFRKVRRGIVSFEGTEWDHVSERARDLVLRLLVMEPEERLTASAALRHPWILCGGDIRARSIPPQLLASWKRFSMYRLLKRLTINMIATMLEPEETMELQVTYYKLCGSGRPLTASNLHIELGRSGYSTSRAEARRLTEIINVSGTGSIQLLEFVAASLKRTAYLREPRLYRAFTTLAQQGSGFIVRADLTPVVGSDAACDIVLAEADTAQNGYIDYKDFLLAMYGQEDLE